MGCDIHLWTESKINGAWVCDQAHQFTTEDDDDEYPSMPEAFRDRHYPLFGLLSAGVRVSWDHAFEPRGIPDDVSTEVKQIHDYWDSDAHSASWLTIREIKEKKMFFLVSADEDAKHAVAALDCLLEGISSHSSQSKEQRIVFFFDN